MREIDTSRIPTEKMFINGNWTRFTDREDESLCLKSYKGESMTENKEDVRQPEHYTLEGVEPYQSIDFIEAILGKEGFIRYCQGSCLKYLVRAGKKDDMRKDFEKARVYLDWIIERV